VTPCHLLTKGRKALQAAAQNLGRAEGLLVEVKSRGAALHFRHTPERATGAQGIAEALAAAFPAFTVQPAKMAFELKPRGATKDVALATVMAQAPFAGRRPVYLGDDLTDEPAMAWAQAQGGIGVKVGPGESCARHRLCDPETVLHWLAARAGAR
jgi:trehalose 6-phosphate phosphatase